MSEMPVETTATEPAQASTPVPATTAPAIDIAAIEKAAAQKAKREAQSVKDQEIARLHRKHQQELNELRAAVAPKLQKAGYEPEPVFGEVETVQKARRYDELQAEADNAARWQQFVNETAEAYGVVANDARLEGATSAQDLQAKARAAMLEDAAKEREKALAEARAAAVAQATAKVNNGDLEVLGGAPAAPAPGLMDQYTKEMQAARGKGLEVGRTIREKYRAKGLNV